MLTSLLSGCRAKNEGSGTVGSFLVDLGENVAVRVGGDGKAGVAQSPAHHEQRHTCLNQNAGRVPYRTRAVGHQLPECR